MKKIRYEDLDIRRDGSIFYNGIPKKFYLTKKGYLQTQVDGKRHYVHRLIAQKYIPNPNNKPTVNHKDGNKSNNSVDNLEWNTYKENNQHAYNTGLKSPSKDVNRKLTMEQAMEIRNKYIPRKYTQQMLSEEYGISQRAINHILHNKIYQSK